MSLSGWRPIVVWPGPRVNREPAFGPRLTTRRPAPSGRSPTETVISSSPTSPAASTGARVIVAGSPLPHRSSTDPHDEQKFEPSGLRCPQRLQKIDVTPTPLALYQLPIPVRVQQRG